ncbi:hypothetical protein N7492_004632 [Penicillium capsulatum]|uniref:Uncharacterized protein n=1 Tax=Penicillium capsulatum TaxID=69766 RepID=A0A9W9IA81_9EURO|nr:hypothetical protein N7492_004632 [Penicillium capsulatum]
MHERIYITVQIQQSHSSSPQSQPKQGFETDLMGFLIELPELPELVEGRIQLIGAAAETFIVPRIVQRNPRSNWATVSREQRTTATI